ncbi:hypothetical protein [Streptomyces sp. Tue6028]|uniref:hypothetical protein n=1 Tax=Streptomyces sp. Tue6028 TaxID=2036037 RepID=UPI003D7209D3
MERRHSALDRTVLALVGLVLLLGGTWLALTDGSLATRLPSWWPAPPPGSVFPDRQRLAELRTEGWWTPIVIAGAVVSEAEAATAPCTVHTRVRFSHRPHRVPHVR